MFRHANRQEKALHQSSINIPLSRKYTHGFRRILSVLVLAAMMVLLVLLSAPMGHAAAKTLAASALETYTFNLINNDRVANGLPPYTWDDNLANGARAHSDLMVGGCGAQHVCPGEPDIGTRITTAVGSCTSCGENIGNWYGAPTYEEDLQNIHNFFISEGPCGCGNHYDNIMSTTFQYVGVGVVIDAGGQVWVTEDFVQP